jgi:hypothetical protein
MATQRISIFGPQQDGPARKAKGSLRLAPTVKNDFFLNALLETPEPSEVAQRHGISHCDYRGADHRAALHCGDNSSKRIQRDPVDCSSAPASASAPNRACDSAYRAVTSALHLHDTETDGSEANSEERCGG